MTNVPLTHPQLAALLDAIRYRKMGLAYSGNTTAAIVERKTLDLAFTELSKALKSRGGIV